MQTELERNLATVRGRIAAAARAAGRSAAEIELVAVTKSVDAATAEALARLGQRDLGESRAGLLEEKAAWLAAHGAPARWHLVGTLQRNKVRRAVRVADVIHSVDDLALLAAIDRVAGEEGRRPDLYLQVKIAPEPGKHGLDPAELGRAIELARGLQHVRLVGLMAMAPLPAAEGERERTARPVFDELARIARGIAADPALGAVFAGGRVRLSMGMTDDFEHAIRAGSDTLRIGRALFEPDPGGALS